MLASCAPAVSHGLNTSPPQATPEAGYPDWTNDLIYEGHNHGRDPQFDVSVNALGWSPDGKHIVTAADDNTVQVWDALSGARRYDHAGHPATSVSALAWSPDGKRIVSASENEAAVLVWRPR